ncbi:MAG: glyceraldehyde 3-phosphate dehydrogenase NAD-binding domain-containing protein, partial [Rhodospirillaceae bacterium]
MAVRVAINGFGRIGRLTLRAALESGRKDIEFVAINDLGSVDMNALLLQYDTTHGRFPKPVRTTKTGINAGSGKYGIPTDNPFV